MEKYGQIVLSLEDSIARIELNRPNVRNAFDDVLIAELTQALEEIAQNEKIRVLILSGRGKVFCAGADLNWMRRMKDFKYEENFEDSLCLARLFHRLYTMPIPTIAKVHGAAIGGGVGLVAASDLVIASASTIFSLSEVRIGLVPACISPYLLKRVNPGMLRGYFLTGTRFSATRAKEIGLVNEVVAVDQLDQTVEKLVENILACGPRALKMAKELLERVPTMEFKESMEYTARVIADLRIGEEGQEGLSAFLEKRKPSWTKGEKSKS